MNILLLKSIYFTSKNLVNHNDNQRGNGRMGNKLVKEQKFSLMEVKGLESSEIVNLGTLLTGIKTETSYTR